MHNAVYTPDLSEFVARTERGNLIPVYREILADLETPVSAFLKIGGGTHSILLESVAGGEQISRYSFISAEPFMVLKTKGREVEITREGERETRTLRDGEDPLHLLKELMRSFQFVPDPDLPPFCGGAVGYIGYDTVRFFERLPDLKPDDRGLPDCYFVFTDTLLIFDHVKHRIKVLCLARVDADPEDAYERALVKIDTLVSRLSGPLLDPARLGFSELARLGASGVTLRDRAGELNRFDTDALGRILHGIIESGLDARASEIRLEREGPLEGRRPGYERIVSVTYVVDGEERRAMELPGRLFTGLAGRSHALAQRSRFAGERPGSIVQVTFQGRDYDLAIPFAQPGSEEPVVLRVTPREMEPAITPIRSDDDCPLEVTSIPSREQHEAAIERAKEYIAAGDVIQVVLSRRMGVQVTAPPVQIYRALRSVNPSPYMFLLQFEECQLIGASPEILVTERGGDVVTRPIAGTVRRGKTSEEDRRLEAQLLADPKEQAEHIMLVDLHRNDIGRVCEYGSVVVDRLMTTEKYSHVIHIVSNVVGKLRPNKDAFDLIRAAFPAGTLSGAPKIRAMEIIEELEPARRGPYGGAIGYFSFNGDLDTCITLRTIVMQGNTAYIQAGGGIVADSDPAAEYRETESKAGAMLRAIELAERGLE